jgi:16S rRNA (guanine527-N7)-methyltransferase
MNSQIEKEPAVAQSIFGSGITKARQYADLLVRDADLLGLLGPRELPKLWTRHILNSAVVSELIGAADTVADIGSGAGFPGIPIAITAQNAQFLLIEPMERRAEWLSDVVKQLDLPNVRVRRARVEEVHDEVFDVVTARALASLPKLLRLAVPITKRGGRVLALKGQKAADEILEAKKLFKKLELADSRILYAGEKFLADATLVVETRLL